MKNKISAIILAAGFSGRMTGFKPLMNFKGKSFLINIIEKLAPFCGKIYVVTGHRAEEIDSHLIENSSELWKQKVETVFNPNFGRGMFGSLKAGIEKCSEADFILYHFADQPVLPENFYAEFIKEADSDYDWIQPVIGNRKGHPILLGKKIIGRIIAAQAEDNLRNISKKGIKKKFKRCVYEEIFLDVDTPEDYAELKKYEM